jgi:excisionase family DNA binding protein
VCTPYYKPTNKKETKMTTTAPKWLTMSQFATQTGLSQSKVKRMKLEGNIPFLQDGRTVRIPIQALEYGWLTNWRQQQVR